MKPDPRQKFQLHLRHHLSNQCNMHYIYGGQRAGNSGANWYLLREMARAAYHRNPAGRFLMGRVDYAIHDERIGGGLLRARRALRVSDFETAIVSFSYNR